MKKIITFICISIFISFSTQAQMNKESREKIKALKVAYLTEQLNLSVSEAEKFWPIYNAYNKEQNTIRGNFRSSLRNTAKKEEINTINEEDAKRLVHLKLKTDKNLYESQKKFIENIVDILSYKKIITLQIAEMEFGRKLMRKYKHKKAKH